MPVLRGSALRLAAVLAVLFLPSFAEPPLRAGLRLDSSEKNVWRFWASNAEWHACLATVTATTWKGMRASEKMPFSLSLPPGSPERLVLEIRPVDLTKGFSFRFSYGMKGEDSGEPDGTPYLVPYAHGARFRLDQSWAGSFTHQGSSRYAVDFTMPEGTAVHAARSGRIVAIKMDGDRGGPSPAFNPYANHVHVLHDDGTIGNYAHFRKNGSRLSVGDRVKAGDLLGESGNTGYSSGPHLHFEVDVLRGGRFQSVPFRLVEGNGAPADPVEGRWYTSTLPGRAPVTLRTAESLRAEDLAGWKAPVPTNGEWALRKEKVDDAVILYLSNGTERPVIGRGLLKVTGASPDLPSARPIRVEPGTEIFLNILRLSKGSKGYDLEFQIE